MRFDSGVVTVTEDKSVIWTLDRAFTPGLAQLLSALAVLLFLGASSSGCSSPRRP